jgi:protocatechuate 3,4-dioxygenase beta subunit
MQIAGITLFPGMEKDVDLVLDWGDAALEGRVLDDRGSPIGGARVSLSWSHDRGAAHSSSLRETVTDEAGVFRFTQLGPGDHEVRIRAIGYHEERQRIPVERQTQHTELRLERTPG